MKQISVLIKPASSLCNLRCSYCFYANISSLREVVSYGKMSEEVMKVMIDNIFVDLEDSDQLTIAFQGGEPTLAGLKYFKSFVEYMNQQEKKVVIDYRIQTNGVVINDRWCQFLKENNFLVGLSIDGHPIYHDMHRLDVKGRGTFNRVLITKNLFDKYQIDYNILCVLTTPLAKEAKVVYEFLKQEKINYVQFIPCLDDFGSETENDYALKPESFFKFYKELFELWLKDLRSGKQISIKLFDDILNLLVAKRITACGILGDCAIQYIIEADGSVYPCDFYVLDELKMGYIQNKTLKELFEQDISKKFVCQKPALAEYCKTCPFLNICRGGCKRMKDSMYLNKESDFCGYQKFLEIFIPKIDEILYLAKVNGEL